VVGGVLLIIASGTVEAGVIVVLQHQPGDPTRPWTWAKVIQQLPAIHAAGYTAILLSPHESACGGGYSLGYDPYDFRISQRSRQRETVGNLGPKGPRTRCAVYADIS